jgi:phospholipid-binding lipoprotein MlaA
MLLAGTSANNGTVTTPVLANAAQPQPVRTPAAEPMVQAAPPLSATASPAQSESTASPPVASPQPPAAATNETVVVGRPHASPGDPLEAVNAQSFAVIQKADHALVAPAAQAYKRNIPSPIRSGLRNFFTNLREPIVFINYLLQLKPGKAGETAGRFALNSTVGVAGLFDIAKRRPFDLPLRINGFANTLGYYGVKPGPFFFIPFLGPTTLRDAIGGSVDGLVLPGFLGKPFNRPVYAISTGIITSLDYRVEYDAELRRLHDESPDPYTTSRDFYLKRRQTEIGALHSARWRAAHPMVEPSEPAAPTTDPAASTAGQAQAAPPPALEPTAPVANNPPGVAVEGVMPGSTAPPSAPPEPSLPQPQS